MRHGREGTEREREMVGGNETGRQRDRETESERWQIEKGKGDDSQ